MQNKMKNDEREKIHATILLSAAIRTIALKFNVLAFTLNAIAVVVVK